MNNTHCTDPIKLDIPKSLSSFEKLTDDFKNFQVLAAGFKTHVFDYLTRHHSATKSQIGDDLGLRGAHLGAFLQALTDIGCLDLRGEQYQLADRMRPLLASGTFWNQQPALEQLLHAQSRWLNLAEFMSEKNHADTRSPDSIFYGQSFIYHPMFREARLIALKISSKVNPLNIQSILCFDGCDFLLSACLKTLYPSARLTTVVTDSALPVTENVAQQFSADKKTELFTGTPLSLSLEQRYDLLVLGHALYSVRKNIADSLKHVAGFIAPQGTLMSFHWFCRENCEPSPGGVEELDKAIITDSHPLCHVRQFSERLTLAGLTDTFEKDFNGAYGTTRFHIARKTS